MRIKFDRSMVQMIKHMLSPFKPKNSDAKEGNSIMKLILALSATLAVSACKTSQANSGIKEDAEETANSEGLQEFLDTMENPIELDGPKVLSMKEFKDPFCTQKELDNFYSYQSDNREAENMQIEARAYILPNSLSSIENFPDQRVIDSLIHVFTYQGTRWKVMAECRHNSGKGEKLRLSYDKSTGFPYMVISPPDEDAGFTHQRLSIARDGGTIELTRDGYNPASDGIYLKRLSLHWGSQRLNPFKTKHCIEPMAYGPRYITCTLSAP
jgi:hypothetical protein